MKPQNDRSEDYSNLEDDETESSGFFAIRDPSFSATNRDSREARLGEERALRDISEALTWLIEYNSDELVRGSSEPVDGDREVPFPLLVPRGHLVLFEEAAARLMLGAFGGVEIQRNWEKQSFERDSESVLPAIREIDAIVVRHIPSKKSK